MAKAPAKMPSKNKVENSRADMKDDKALGMKMGGGGKKPAKKK